MTTGQCFNDVIIVDAAPLTMCLSSVCLRVSSSTFSPILELGRMSKIKQKETREGGERGREKERERERENNCDQ